MRFRTELIELFNRSKPQRKEILLLFFTPSALQTVFLFCLCYVCVILFGYVSLRCRNTLTPMLKQKKCSGGGGGGGKTIET